MSATTTQEGYLIYKAAKLMRVGRVTYRRSEIPKVRCDSEGNVTVIRDADALFDRDTIASFGGKDIVLNHPRRKVTPGTWRDASVGSVINPRRGAGPDSDYLVADLIVKRPDAIRAIEGGLTQLSVGGDSDFEEIEPGVARQTMIRANHVAIVDRGKNGKACALDAAVRMNAGRLQTEIEHFRSLHWRS
ncbi:DUF2213 domain-containing protein [Rhodoblastus sp.]|uniref:DUF2213 domain-containing protein n=1 Tax=Rhodoblastus sp. TaxID=1962975 RepID=UPI003F9A1BD4